MTAQTGEGSGEQNRKKVILDVDTGIDDALAILYALNSPLLEVVGITTSYGNVDVDTAVNNTLAVVETLDTEIPVYRGAETPVARQWNGPAPWIHGENGLGNADLPQVERKAEGKDAVTFIRETLRAYPGEVTLILLAPLTNIAMAFVETPELVPLAEEIVLMGGAAFCPGNVTPAAEANIWADPEAAKLVFQSGAKVTMVGLDVTMKARLYREEVEQLPTQSPSGRLLRQSLTYYLNAYEKEGVRGGTWCPVHDPLAVALAEDDARFYTKCYHVDIETDGRLTAGMTVVDARQKPAHEANARVCLDVDEELFRRRLLKRMEACCS